MLQSERNASKSRTIHYIIDHTGFIKFRHIEYGRKERKSDRFSRKAETAGRELQAKERTTGSEISSIIQLFTGETACKCYSICLMESLPAFLP